MAEAGPELAERIRGLIAREMSDFAADTSVAEATLAAFRAALEEPAAVEVQFSGGVMQQCWSVTRANGPYRVVYMPRAGYFSLCVEGQFGPLDIGVHGTAIGCFGSV
ncbi:hypothetical protein LCL97_05615 [Seohaeicola saemankumensis]|nr:hypothetical protein [Seohaeicola saemankumensis]MCA0870290.1 hypothetical protein [Seohaeicola saemankumensis]